MSRRPHLGYFPSPQVFIFIPSSHNPARHPKWLGMFSQWAIADCWKLDHSIVARWSTKDHFLRSTRYDSTVLSVLHKGWSNKGSFPFKKGSLTYRLCNVMKTSADICIDGLDYLMHPSIYFQWSWLFEEFRVSTLASIPLNSMALIVCCYLAFEYSSWLCTWMTTNRTKSTY